MFKDEPIKLIIATKKPSTGLFFKAYLEKSELQVKFIDENLKYVPLGYKNNTILTRTQYNVDFSFNVFAENKEEAAVNYDLLHRLIDMMKPNYTVMDNQYIPDLNNLFGNIQIEFEGMPKIKDSKILDIYVTNFSYQINKDLGFLQGPFVPRGNNAETKQFKEKFASDNKTKAVELEPSEKNRFTDQTYKYESPLIYNVDFSERFDTLIPIGYKIDISGRVLLHLDYTIKSNEKISKSPAIEVKKQADEKKATNEKLFSQDPDKLNKCLLIAQKVSGKTIDEIQALGPKKYAAIITSAKALFDEELVNDQGEFYRFSDDLIQNEKKQGEEISETSARINNPRRKRWAELKTQIKEASD